MERRVNIRSKLLELHSNVAAFSQATEVDGDWFSNVEKQLKKTQRIA